MLWSESWAESFAYCYRFELIKRSKTKNQGCDLQIQSAISCGILDGYIWQAIRNPCIEKRPPQDVVVLPKTGIVHSLLDLFGL